ncbi:MAG: hypothetical protein HLUCCO18_11085 [Rhodobacteraceae bacterium HLUCCO18]|nr:MAG: hypothetical protein HLUCCO18_11085 [Rhodobacteraceae bacterium HLUCCO18]
MIRSAALVLLLSAAPVAAQEGSPFFGEWCGIETRLWVGQGHIGFNEHTVCTPRRDPATGTAPTFATRVDCRNLYIQGEGEDVSLVEVPIDYMTSITFTLTDPDTLYIDLDDGTAPDLFVRCP